MGSYKVRLQNKAECVNAIPALILFCSSRQRADDLGGGGNYLLPSLTLSQPAGSGQ